jgi:hypothetical protein
MGATCATRFCARLGGLCPAGFELVPFSPAGAADRIPDHVDRFGHQLWRVHHCLERMQLGATFFPYSDDVRQQNST